MSFFILLSAVFSNLFIIPVDIENIRLKLALVISTGAPITVANNSIECYHLLQIKQLKIYQNGQQKQYT